MKKITNQKMKIYFRTMLLTTCLSLILSVSNTWAQKGCKPDYSKMDKIEKKQIDQWTCELYETGLGGRMMNTSAISINFNIGKMDTLNYVEVQLIKIEASDENAKLVSSLKGEKGNEFYFGLKDGDPLKFVAFEATNKTQRLSISGKLATVVTLTSEIKSEDLQKTKDALTGKIIDAVRVKLENGLIIDQSIKDKNGEKAKDKSVCFFNFLQEKGYMK